MSAVLAPLLARVAGGHELNADELEQAVGHLVAPEVPEDDKAAFLVGLHQKGETAGEIAGLARALLARAVDPELDRAQLAGPLLDVCGTGGDRAELFNVSTTCMFVAAAAGAVVVKHGNRAITSQSGGADVLEELGVPIDLTPAELRRRVLQHGLGFLFAPHYHPAFKAIAPVRKRLAAQGHTTVFNLLGPLLNPARPDFQLIGLFARDALSRYAEALAQLGRTRAWVVHGGGLDELTTTGPSEVCEVGPGSVTRRFMLNPLDYGIPLARMDDLRGGDRLANTIILERILSGEPGPRRDLVVLNSGAALHLAGLAPDLESAFASAREQIDSGRALAKLRALQETRS